MVDIVIRLLEVIIELEDFFLLFFFNELEAMFSRTASLHPWDDRTPRCSHSRMLFSTVPKSNCLVLLWIARVTIFVMVGRQVMGR